MERGSDRGLWGECQRQATGEGEGAGRTLVQTGISAHTCTSCCSHRRLGFLSCKMGVRHLPCRYLDERRCTVPVCALVGGCARVSAAGLVCVSLSEGTTATLGSGSVLWGRWSPSIHPPSKTAGQAPRRFRGRGSQPSGPSTRSPAHRQARATTGELSTKTVCFTRISSITFTGLCRVITTIRLWTQHCFSS